MLKLSDKTKAVSIVLLLSAQSSNAELSEYVDYGSFRSYQINVDNQGKNIANDKANEPSIAVNPLNPDNLLIGWRRFEPLALTKQAGFAYSFDGGKTWKNGVLPALADQQRTDPVLDTDAQGNFYYQSMAHGSVNSSSVFKSSDGGKTWSQPVHQFIGDKNWLAIDKTNGPSQGYIYSSWRRASTTNPDPDYQPRYFIRSTDGGKSYQEPEQALPVTNLGFGRIALGPESNVYLSGVKEDVKSTSMIGVIRQGFYFLKSVNAKDPNVSPSFSFKQVNMGGEAIMPFIQSGPNPLGSYGDVQIASDRSNGLMRGNIYMMSHVLPAGWQVGNDPLDMNFIRSDDGGENWSDPIRINDDLASADSYQWFPMLDVAPNSRIDAVWYDTRNSTDEVPGRQSQLFYAYSWDGGRNWSENRAVTALFNTHLPSREINGKQQPADKMGDYTQLISDENGAHIAYAATFNGEQDVYYLNVFPDCNDNARSDVLDIKTASSFDRDSNQIPDECETSILVGDLDQDGDVDRDDMSMILAARGQQADSEQDPKDINADGLITLRDVRLLRSLCTRSRCATE